MKLDIDPADLRPLVEAVVAETLAAAAALGNGDRLSYGEAEAASLLGVPRHVLRDMRYAGDVRASKVGKRVVYQRCELLRILAANELEPRR